MSGPLAKGIIIAASVVVAAGIAIMENEQVRQWLDIHRRRLATAIYSLGDGINPCDSDSNVRSPEQQAEMADLTLQRRHAIVQRNREELLRRAREEGTAVDLDELTALGLLEKEAREEADRAKQQIRNAHQRSNSNASFDDFVGTDGKLKNAFTEQQDNTGSSATATAVPATSDTGLRHRGAGARGFAFGSVLADPFGDDMELHEDSSSTTPEIHEVQAAKSRFASSQLEAEVPPPNKPVAIRDIPIWEAEPARASSASELKTEDEFNAEIQEAIRRSLEESTSQLVDISSPETLQPSITGDSIASTPHSLADSLFSPSSPRVAASHPHFATPEMSTSSRMMMPSSSHGSFFSAAGQADELVDVMDDGGRTPIGSGTLTPTDDGFSTISSVAGDYEPEHLSHADAQSNADTNDSFSVVGANTPGTWSDVGSDSDSEMEAGNGQSHIVRR